MPPIYEIYYDDGIQEHELGAMIMPGGGVLDVSREEDRERIKAWITANFGEEEARKWEHHLSSSCSGIREPQF